MTLAEMTFHAHLLCLRSSCGSGARRWCWQWSPLFLLARSGSPGCRNLVINLVPMTKIVVEKPTLFLWRLEVVVVGTTHVSTVLFWIARDAVAEVTGIRRVSIMTIRPYYRRTT